MIKSLYRFLSKKHQTVFLDYPVKAVPRYGHGKPPHEGLYQEINKGRDQYAELLVDFMTQSQNLQRILPADQQKDPLLPSWNNGFFPGLDIVVLYGMISKFKPNKYVEVGSGNSTKVAHYAKTNLGLSTEIVSIDPQPRAEIDQLADTIHRMPFENVDYDLILSLEKNDILFIDNSHRILPNSDAMVFFMEILPQLKPGVIVHIHDIYLPYDYPQFMCDRYYSEQYGLAMYILANPRKYSTLMPNYFVSEDKELAGLMKDFWNSPNTKNVERHGGSYWLQIGS